MYGAGDVMLKRIRAALAGLFVLAGAGASLAQPTVSMGPTGLVYTADAMGNRIIDFSYAGYMGGGVTIPTLPIKATVSPVAGDNTTSIQNAINTVSAMALNSQGYRGAVFLNPGTYPISGTLTISASGVVLRGSGPGTTLNFTGTPRQTILVSGSSGLTGTGSTFSITDTYAPVGATTLTLSGTTGLAVG